MLLWQFRSEEEGPIPQGLKGLEELPPLHELHYLSCQDSAEGPQFQRLGGGGIDV